MRSYEHYESAVVRVRKDATAREIANRMERNAVGCVVVTDADDHVVGIVTDRDLLRRVVAAGRDGESAQARDIMTEAPVCGDSHEPLERLIEKMKSKGVRRLPIVRNGAPVGMVTLDDVLVRLAEELSDVGEAVRSEVLGSRRDARRRHRRESLEAAVEEIGAQVQQLGSQTASWVRKEIEALWRRSR